MALLPKVTSGKQFLSLEPKDNMNYKAMILCQDQGISVVASLPENFTFDVGAQYEAPFSQGLNSAAGDTIGGAARAIGISLTSQAFTAQIWQGSTDIELSLELQFQTEDDPIRDVQEPILDLLRLVMPRTRGNVSGGLFESPGPHIDYDTLRANYAKANPQKGDIGLMDLGQGLFSGLVDTAKKALGDASKGNLMDAINGPLSELNNVLMSSVKNKISIYIGNYMYFSSVVITDVQQTYTSQFDDEFNLPMHATVAVRFRPFVMPTQNDLRSIFPQSDFPL